MRCPNACHNSGMIQACRELHSRRLARANTSSATLGRTASLPGEAGAFAIKLCFCASLFKDLHSFNQHRAGTYRQGQPTVDPPYFGPGDPGTTAAKLSVQYWLRCSAVPKIQRWSGRADRPTRSKMQRRKIGSKMRERWKRQPGGVCRGLQWTARPAGGNRE